MLKIYFTTGSFFRNWEVFPLPCPNLEYNEGGYRYILQEPQITTAIIAKYSHAVFAGCDKNSNLLTLGHKLCKPQNKGISFGVFGLTSHKWFLKQEELTSSLLSAFRFPDCIVKQRKPVSAHIHRAILVGRTSWGHLVKPHSEQDQLDQVAQGCADISESPRTAPLGSCYSVWPHHGENFFFITHFPLHANTLCLLPVLCTQCTSGKKKKCLALLYL